jgi:DNA-binding NarL/FixJ family response regulator
MGKSVPTNADSGFAFLGGLVANRIRVLIADDDERVRRSFTALLELETDTVVVGTVGDGEKAVEAAHRLRPDVIVMDVRMPRLDGIAATQRIRASNPTWGRILVATTFDLDEYVLGAARAGASGFILKDQAPEELAKAVSLVASGEAMVSPRATARLLQEFVKPVANDSSVELLTDREVEIVQLMARGLSNEEIARQAFISVGTVKTHVSSILTKLNLQSRIQIVVWAFEHRVAVP